MNPPPPPPPPLPYYPPDGQQRRTDADHLHLLSVFHLIWGLLAMLGILGLWAHWLLMTTVLKHFPVPLQALTADVAPQSLPQWVLAPDMYWDRGEKFYVFALLTGAEDTTTLSHSVQTVLSLVDASAREGMDFAVTTLDYGDPAIAAMMRGFPPFYAAPDYQPAVE